MARINLREKFYRMMKENRTADEIYMSFIKSEPEEIKKKGLELLKDFAKTSNKDKKVRSKALALIGYFKHMSCGQHAEKFYDDIKFICEDQEVIKIIEENIEELIIYLEKPNINLMKDADLNHLLYETISIIEEYNLKTDTSKKFFTMLIKSLDLQRKYAKNSLNERESLIYNRLQRMNLI